MAEVVENLFVGGKLELGCINIFDAISLFQRPHTKSRQRYIQIMSVILLRPSQKNDILKISKFNLFYILNSFSFRKMLPLPYKKRKTC